MSKIPLTTIILGIAVAVVVTFSVGSTVGHPSYGLLSPALNLMSLASLGLIAWGYLEKRATPLIMGVGVLTGLIGGLIIIYF